MYIVKRDGSLVLFNQDKIIDAINKAFIDVDGQLYEDDTAKDIAAEILEKIKKYYELKTGNLFSIDPKLFKDYLIATNDFITVEQIQDWIEDFLMQSERKDVAKSYIRYRYKKEVAREKKDDFIAAIREKLDGSNNQKKNANVDEESFGGRTGEGADVVTRQFALDYIISKMAKDNHLNNEIYIHDLNSYYVGSHNCLSIPFDDLLSKGFKTRQTDVRPANSVNTAFQLVAVIFQLQSLQQFGGVSATHLDWTMVPYVRRSFYKHYCNGLKYIENREIDYEFTPDSPIDWEDYKIFSPKAYKYAMDMTKKEINQSIEGLLHNLKELGRLNSNIKNIAA